MEQVINIPDKASEEIDKNPEKLNETIPIKLKIPIKEITDFQNHPYKVIDNEQMKELSESIKENGLFMPVIVRPKKNGRIWNGFRT